MCQPINRNDLFYYDSLEKTSGDGVVTTTPHQNWRFREMDYTTDSIKFSSFYIPPAPNMLDFGNFVIADNEILGFYLGSYTEYDNYNALNPIKTQVPVLHVYTKSLGTVSIMVNCEKIFQELRDLFLDDDEVE